MDQELKDLFNRLGKAVIIIIVFILVVTFALIRKFNSDESKVIGLVRQKKDIVLLLRKTKCYNCKEIKNELKNSNISYHEVKTDTEKYYNTLLKELDITKNDIQEPTIIKIKDGNVVSMLVDISNISELHEYINNNE